MKSLSTFLFAASALALTLAGCTPAAPAAPAPAAPKAEAPKPEAPKPAPKPAAPKPTTPQPAAKPAPQGPVEYVTVEPNLLYNGSFETWSTDGSIASWNLAEGFDQTWNRMPGTKVAPAPQGGSSAIELPVPGENQTVVLSQSILAGKLIPARRLLVSAVVKGTEKESLHMLLTYRVGQQTETIRRVHQGGDTWTKLEAQFWIPQNADPASFRIQFIVQRGVKQPVQLDDVQLKLMAPKGSPGTTRPAVATPKPLVHMTPPAGAAAPAVAPAAAAVAPAPAAAPAATPAPAPAPAAAPAPAPAAAPAPEAAPAAEAAPATDEAAKGTTTKKSGTSKKKK